MDCLNSHSAQDRIYFLNCVNSSYRNPDIIIALGGLKIKKEKKKETFSTALSQPNQVNVLCTVSKQNFASNSFAASEGTWMIYSPCVNSILSVSKFFQPSRLLDFINVPAHSSSVKFTSNLQLSVWLYCLTTCSISAPLFAFTAKHSLVSLQIHLLSPLSTNPLLTSSSYPAVGFYFLLKKPQILGK